MAGSTRDGRQPRPKNTAATSLHLIMKLLSIFFQLSMIFSRVSRRRAAHHVDLE